MGKLNEEIDLPGPEGFSGAWHTDRFTRRVYATDASAYQELPRAVAIPRNEADIARLIDWANEVGLEKGLGLIPRTAGTSLAGQVVGSGVVVDVSRHFREILEIDAEAGWVRVQPGVIRNELNLALRPHGWLFGPETATANRAMIGGMVGNNSCGANSVVYGTTRDHVLGLRGFLADGREVSFGALASSGEKVHEEEGADRVVEAMRALVEDSANRAVVAANWPRADIHRRNTGYALDALMEAFDLCKLVAGSEGTLFFVTEVMLGCVRLPPPVSGLVCVHCGSVDEALRATRVVMRDAGCGFRDAGSGGDGKAARRDLQDTTLKVARPWACELMDGFIIDGARRSRGQAENLWWIEGEPKAVLVVEVRGDDSGEVRAEADSVEAALRAEGLGQAFPLVEDPGTKAVWAVRRAGLGVLSNVPGPAKPQPVIEDTAVRVADLPAYIADVREVLDRLGLSCVFYAHAGSGELHLRPLLNLRSAADRRRFREVAEAVAEVVRRYGGSLSGEHGDGRLRAEFLERMIGPEGLSLCRQVKAIWDPKGIFNPGKIVDAPPMDEKLRTDVYVGRAEGWVPEISTVMDWGEEGIVGAVEKCNGSGDCRKTHRTGGTMCPSYMGTRAERDTTRARANVLRQAWTGGLDATAEREAKAVLELCLSCKGCKRECPSNVDMARMKAEFMQGWHDRNGVPLRTRVLADLGPLALGARIAPGVVNRMLRAGWVKRRLGLAEALPFPAVGRETLRSWMRKRGKGEPDDVPGKRVLPMGGNVEGMGCQRVADCGEVLFYADEITNLLDVEAGKAGVRLLEALGYRVRLAGGVASGRLPLSQGLVRKARKLAEENVRRLAGRGTIVGVEPSAVMTFRDEVPDLVAEGLRERARGLAGEMMMLEEFLVREVGAGRIDPAVFSMGAGDGDGPGRIWMHGHCHQKAVGSMRPVVRALGWTGRPLKPIASGCCGMAGSFGYVAEHAALARTIGELVLLPTVRKAAAVDWVVATGTSCRHQIELGTGRRAMGVAEALWLAFQAGRGRGV